MLNINDMPYKLGSHQEVLPSKNSALMMSTFCGRTASSSPNKLLLPCIHVIFPLDSCEAICFLWLTFKKKKRWKRKKLKFILILLYQTIYCIQHILPSNFLPQRKESIILGALIVKCNKLTLSGSAWQSVFSQMEQQNLCLRLFIAMLTHQARDLVNTEKNGHCIREPTTMICVIISW